MLMTKTVHLQAVKPTQGLAAELVIILCGFVTMNEPFHIAPGYLNHLALYDVD